MSDQPYFVVVDAHGRVLWHGQAASAAAAVRNARSEPMDNDWTDQPPRATPQRVEVIVNADPPAGPRALRRAIAWGRSLGSYQY